MARGRFGRRDADLNDSAAGTMQAGSIGSGADPQLTTATTVWTALGLLMARRLLG